MYKVFSVISATISSLIPAVFPRLGAVIRYTFTADFKDRLIDVYKDRVTEIDFKKRMQKLYKLRDVLANKRQDKAQK